MHGPIRVPVCGDADTAVSVCSKACRDEYLGGFVETRGGKAIRLLHLPRGPGDVPAAAWLFYAAVRLVGPLLDRVVDLPLLPDRRGLVFPTAGLAALVVAWALLRRMRPARWISAVLAGAGLIYAVLAWTRSGDTGWALEAVTFHPAVIALSLGDPRPRRVVPALAVLALYPAALAITALGAAVQS